MPVPVHTRTPGAPVRITEGELKADVATLLSGVLTLSVPGVSAWRRALPLLQQLGVTTVHLAFDADWRQNPHVARALAQATQAIVDAEYTVAVETWDIAQGKGIDDVLATGYTPVAQEATSWLQQAQPLLAPPSPDADHAADDTEHSDNLEGRRDPGAQDGRHPGEETLLMAIKSMDCTPSEDGTMVFTNGEDVRITVIPAADSKHQPLVLVTYQGQDITKMHANLLLGQDIETLTRNCGTRVGDIDWHGFFAHISTRLTPPGAPRWEAVVRTFSSYRPERKEYFWYPILPRGEPTLLDGDPGQGKSAMVVKLCVHMTKGQAFPTLFAERPERDFDPQHVALLTYEDSPSSTILPRVAINGGNPDLVHLIEGKRHKKGEVIPVTMQDIATLMAVLEQYHPALLVFDPIQSFFGPGVDINKATDTRPVLDGVRNLCKAYSCTPLYVRHNGKSEHVKAMHSGLGSIDITANMRSALALYEDQEVPQRRILAQTKTNGRRAPSIQCLLSSGTYDFCLDCNEVITVEDVRLDWDGLSPWTAADLNAQQWARAARANDEEKSALDEAREFLRDILADGPMLVDEVRQAARKAGISTATLKRAKSLKGIKAQRRPIEGKLSRDWPWEWPLPTRTPGEDDVPF